MDYEKIGKFIATSRKKQGLTQKELANLLNITDRAVSKWERGKGCPDVSLLEGLSKLLNVSIIELLKGEKINNREKIKKEELLYSMNYVKNIDKNKINNTINIVIITLISIIILLLLFNNLKISILFNYKYYPNIMFVDNKNIFEELETKINLINNNREKYKFQELEQIISIINKYKDEDRITYEKEYYTYNDIKKIILRDDFNDISKVLKLTIYNKFNNITWNNDIEYFIDNYYEDGNIIKNFINNSYKYDYIYNKEENIGNELKSLIYYKYYVHSIILEDIINGGEINE